MLWLTEGVKRYSIGVTMPERHAGDAMLAELACFWYPRGTDLSIVEQAHVASIINGQRRRSLAYQGPCTPVLLLRSDHWNWPTLATQRPKVGRSQLR